MAGIFLDARKFEGREAAARYAEDVAARLRAGADFTAAATQLRQAGYNVQLSDDGVGEKPGEIRPAEAEPVLFRLKPGEVGPVVELPGGLQIVRVWERGYAGKKPLTLEVQGEIRKKVTSLYADREYRQIIEDMKSKAVIQRDSVKPAERRRGTAAARAIPTPRGQARYLSALKG